MTSTHPPSSSTSNGTAGNTGLTHPDHNNHSNHPATINPQSKLPINLQHPQNQRTGGAPLPLQTGLQQSLAFSTGHHYVNGAIPSAATEAGGTKAMPLSNGCPPATTAGGLQRHNGFSAEPIYEGLTMNRKIRLNGGNELRIDEKNISLHLNNPFVSNYSSQPVGAIPVATACASPTPSNYASVESLHRNGGPMITTPSAAAMPSNVMRPAAHNPSNTESVYDRPVRRPQSIAVASPLNQRQNELAKEQPVYSYGQSFMGGQSPFKNSPQRTLPSRNSQEFSLYTPPSPLANQPAGPGPVVQRRSQSVPRPLQLALTQPALPSTPGKATAPPGGSTLIQRPRSLDRCNGINPPDKGYKPPIPNRRLSQSGLAGVPPTTTARTVPNAMRQSATFHGQGQLNRLAANFNYPTSENGTPPDAAGRRNKADRPLSYAYGTLPDQVFLENQLRIYSEQLRNITESVRKYSEQAKLLSEMKRQQQQQKQGPGHQFTNSVPIVRSESAKGLYLGGNSDSNSSLSSVANTPGEDPQTPSHQLRLFLDNIRSNIKEPSQDDLIPEAAEPPPEPLHKARIPPADPIKTPSDQLRQFLDAIRSNQVPEETDIKGACDRFYKFKEKVEQSRPKSMQTNPISPPVMDGTPTRGISASESFSQISDNLRIMNQDLEALAQKSPKQSAKCGGTSPLSTHAERQIMQFNRLLDDFQRMTGHQHAPETVDYFRKCSEGLRHVPARKPGAGEQLSVSTSFGNGFGGGELVSDNSSSCSTTPGSIREAVQSLLMQPRNGVQIMDDRMRLFIEIVDSQDKFSQVKVRMAEIEEPDPVVVLIKSSLCGFGIDIY